MDDLYQTLIEAQNEAGEGFFMAEAGRILYANDACARISGYSLKELLNMPSLYDLVVPEQRELLRERFARRLGGERVIERYETTLIHKNGRPVDLEVTVKPLPEDRTRRVIIIRDITGRKQVERNLIESENRFRQLFEHSVDTLLVHDEMGRMVDCNAEACRSLGYTREELLSLHVRDFATSLLSEEEKKSLGDDTLWRRTMHSEPGTNLEEAHLGEHRRKDGTTFPVEVRVGAVDYDGERMILASVRDISERQWAEEALRESEERFRSLVQNSTDLITVVDVKGTILYESPSVERVLGYKPEERVVTNIFDYIHPEDLAYTRQVLAEGLTTTSTNGTKTTGEKIEARIRHADGSWRILEALASNLLEDPGVEGIVINSRDVTERRWAEEELLRSEARNKVIVEATPDLIIRYGRDGEYLDIQANDPDKLYLPREELMGSNLREMLPSEVAEPFLVMISRTLDTGEVQTYEYQLNVLEGVVDFEARLVVCGPDEALCTVRDVTERKRNEAALRQQNEYLSALHDTSLALMNRLELSELLEAVVARAAALIGTSHGYMYLLEPGETELEMRVGIGVFGEYAGYRMKRGECVPGQVWQSGRPVVVDDYRAWECNLPQFSQDIHAVIGAPLKSGSEVVGVIGLAYLEEERKFGKEELELLTRFAGLASVALDNARLYTRAQQELAERERTEAALRESEERYRMLVEAVQEGIGFVDAEEIIVYCNEAYAEIFGTSQRELMGKSLLKFLDERERRKALEQTAMRRNGVRSSYELSIMSRGGERKELSASGSPIVDADGNFRGAVHTIIDITESKKSLEVLKQQSVAMMTAMDGMAILDQNDAYVYMNDAHARIYGYEDPGDLIGKSWRIFYDEEQLILLERYAVPALQRNGQWRGEAIGKKSDGREFSQEISLTLIGDGGMVCVVRDISERKALEEQLAYQAFHDPLTGLPNRTLFMDRMDHALARASRREDSVAVIFMDLDNFKVINDSLGHEVGDQLLRAASHRLQPCLRPGDTIARLGGDEFTILLEHIDGVDEAVRVAERIAETMQIPFSLNGQDLFVTFSLGIAFGAADRSRPGDLLRDADLALYQAKGSGKAHYEIFDPIMNTRALERLELGNDLRRALERDEFKVCYQPKVHLGTGKIAGFEALVRWEHPERGLMTPSEFVPVAEETGLILPIGQRVLEEACGQASEWRRRYPDAPSLLMSVNLSARQFQHPNLAHDVARVLRETRADGYALCLEITESVVMEDAPHTTATLRNLKELGVKLSVDDFGTGYSSLSYLKRFPVSYLKIDRSFVEELKKDPEDTAMISGIIALAHTLNMRVVAEGVEWAEQASRLRKLGCDLAQGNYFSKPLPAKEAAALLAREARP